MKNSISLSRLQEIEKQLRKQIAALHLICQETEQAEYKIKHISYTEKTQHTLIKLKESLNDNIRVLTLMATVINEAIAQYHRAEKEITDRYNLDIVFYPKAEFAVNYITGLDNCRSLIPF